MSELLNIAEPLIANYYYEDGILPGFEAYEDKIVTECSLFVYLRSAQIAEQDIDEKGYIKATFFERRGMELLNNELFDREKDTLYDEDKNNQENNQNLIYSHYFYFQGEILNRSSFLTHCATFFMLQEERVVRSFFCIEAQSLRTKQDFELYFAFLAEIILRYTTLKVQTEEYDITEIEFYYKNDVSPCDPSAECEQICFHPVPSAECKQSLHSDPYPHKENTASEALEWYFHQKGDSYKAGTFKGLDITLGGAHSSGGILIRSIRSRKNDEFICGPSLVVDKLLQVAQVESIPEFIEKDCLRLHFRRYTLYKQDILSSIRVGLSLKNKEDLEYLLREYRFARIDTRLKKGRVHFLTSLVRKGYSDTDISKIFVTRSLSDIRAALKEKNKVKDFIKRKLTDKDIPYLFTI